MISKGLQTQVENPAATKSPMTLLDRWIAFLLVANIPLLLLAVGLSVWSFDVAKRLKLNADITSLMPDGVPSVENLQKVVKLTGGYSSAMVIVESPDPDAAERYLRGLRETILKLDWVSGAEYAEDTAVFERNRLIYVEQGDLREMDNRLAARMDYEKKNLNFDVDGTPVQINIRGAEDSPPVLALDDIQEKYQGKNAEAKKAKLFRDESNQFTILVVFPKGGTTNVTYAREVIHELQKVIDESDPASYHPDLSIEIGGRVKNLVAKFESAGSDVEDSGLWAITAILLVVILFYRRFMAVLYIGLPLVVGFLLTFALTKIALGGLNLMTIFLILILFGLGIDFGIHNLARYDEVRKTGGSMKQALRTIYSKTGHASFLAAVTTIAGFYSLMLTNFKAFSEFGFIAGSGIALTLFSMYVFFPALIVFAERIKLYRVPKMRQGSSQHKQRTFPYAYPILFVACILILLSAVLAPSIQFEEDFGKLKTKIPELGPINEKIKQVFPLRSDKAVVFVERLEDVGPLVDEIKRIQQSRPEDERTIEKVRSIYSVVPKTEDQQERLRAIESIQQKLLEARRLLEDFSDPNDPRKKDIEQVLDHFGVSVLTPEDLPPAIQRTFTGIPGSGGYLVYIYNSKGMNKLNDAQDFVEDIRTLEVNGRKFYPATDVMIFVDMLKLMKNDAGRAVIVVLVAVFVVLTIAFRNLKHTLVVMVPVVVGMIWMLGLMVALGLKLNIFNMVVLPTVLGIGIDNGIHIFQRYREEGGYVLHVVRTTGGAAFLTTLTTMLGFAGTLTASNQGLQSLGLVAFIGLGCCMVSSLTLFPALLQLVEDRRVKTA